MSTLPPDELLKLWKREQLPLEMSMGHVLQNLVSLRADFAAQHAALTTLRGEVDHIIAYIQLPPNTKGKTKPSKSNDAPEPE